jgi:hypothetical protein
MVAVVECIVLTHINRDAWQTERTWPGSATSRMRSIKTPKALRSEAWGLVIVCPNDIGSANARNFHARKGACLFISSSFSSFYKGARPDTPSFAHFAEKRCGRRTTAALFVAEQTHGHYARAAVPGFPDFLNAGSPSRLSFRCRT